MMGEAGWRVGNPEGLEMGWQAESTTAKRVIKKGIGDFLIR